MEYFFAPFIVFQLLPATALLPAALLLVLLRIQKNAADSSTRPPRRLIVGSALLWIAYACWEYRVQVWAATESAPIRVDLLLIYPLLTIMTLWSLIALWRSRRAATREPSRL